MFRRHVGVRFSAPNETSVECRVSLPSFIFQYALARPYCCQEGRRTNNTDATHFLRGERERTPGLPVHRRDGGSGVAGCGPLRAFVLLPCRSISVCEWMALAGALAPQQSFADPAVAQYALLTFPKQASILSNKQAILAYSKAFLYPQHRKVSAL